MNVCAIPDETLLLDVTNMEDIGINGGIDLTSIGGNEVRDPKGVKAEPTPTAANPMVLAATMEPRSDGNGGHCRNRPGNVATRKDCSRSFHDRPDKSVHPNTNQPEDVGDPAAKKRKTRRGKPKHRKMKPYRKQQMSYSQRLRCRADRRLTKTGGQPPAPYNTTQFLMEDHSDLPDLEQKLADAMTSEVPPSFQKPLAPPRTRDSSFSIDSEEDYFYSSPEDEEEFLTKEFATAYEDLHAERLNTMTKSELIQEYVQLEAKLDMMSKRLRGKSFQPEVREIEPKNGTVTFPPTCDNEIAKKLKNFQQRIDDLTKQNEQLRRENENLRSKNCGSPASSVDSESDSDSDSTSTNGNQSSCSYSAENSPNNEKSFQNRLDNEVRRSKRQSSVESDGENTITSNGEIFEGDRCSQNGISNDLVNGIAGNHEIEGLPT